MGVVMVTCNLVVGGSLCYVCIVVIAMIINNMDALLIKCVYGNTDECGGGYGNDAH